MIFLLITQLHLLRTSEIIRRVLEGVIEKLRSSTFELYAYNTRQGDDELTSRIKGHFNEFRTLVGKSDEDSAEIIHRDGINVLIDLSGHTAGNRLRLFALKPAPIQITWLGYFASTGVDEMDFIIGDPYVTPPSEESHFVEKVLRLPESYLCFTQPIEELSCKPLPALRNGYVTFGCFTAIARITDKVISTWAKILTALPNSKLYLKDKYLADKECCRLVVDRFKSSGISDRQLILAGPSTRSEYLASYEDVDIALSPFPYGGGTISVEGMWMGVPVITMKGDHFVSHIGETIAWNTGMEGWIANDEKGYVDKAIRYASNLDKLANIRGELRTKLKGSPLMDTKKFAVNFENAIRKICLGVEKY